MKASEVRRLAGEHTLESLQEAVRVVTEDGGSMPFDVAGDDPGEQLTNVLLALQLRERLDAGEDPRDAFRQVMKDVRSMTG